MKLKNIFSLVKEDSDYFNEKLDKIQLQRCAMGGQKCKEQLAVVNKNFVESGKYVYNKNYNGAMETLKSAFYVTFELNESTCLKCAAYFRSTITHSLESIQEELGAMSTGMFKTNKYQSNYIEACKTLVEFKNLKQSYSEDQNKQKDLFQNQQHSKCVG